ncbi:hypothetical protein [Haladaptatus sp. YSMS36]|uniref:DUF7139 domain-containing protein n=1 Tax=Haladaptatus sp. YSMS36 TaxID=3033384 RepID=UPI0023E7F981|nr:hypothetical protein [Haladaptatus sp. YSMS36]
MESIADAYSKREQSDGNTRRLLLGVLFLVAGTVGLLSAIAMATTSVFESFGWSVFEARKLAGVLAGVAIPALLLGVVIALPTEKGALRGVLGGSMLAFVGVALFQFAYPYWWNGATTGNPDLTLVVVGLYFLGTIIAFAYVFVAVATFKTRNTPGDMVTVEITTEGETRTVEVHRSEVARTISQTNRSQSDD